MAQKTDKQPGVLRSLDWWTIGIYVALLVFGWLSVCGASYSYEEPDIFSLSTRSGMQIVWIGSSLMLGLVILLLDDRYYDRFSYIIYGFLLFLLFATIFNPVQIKGSRSWIVLGPLRVQPAEFAKFATALAIEGDGVGTGLPLFLPDVLPRRHAGQHPLHRCGHGHLFCGGHTL